MTSQTPPPEPSEPPEPSPTPAPADAADATDTTETPGPLGRRAVRLERVAAGRYAVTNPRGGVVTLGRGADADYTPVELLLAAIAGCTAVDVDEVTSRRAEPESFLVDCEGIKVSDELGNHLSGVEVTFRLVFPDDEGGRAATALVPRLVRLSHEKLCTVSRTVMLPTPVRSVIADPAASQAPGD